LSGIPGALERWAVASIFFEMVTEAAAVFDGSVTAVALMATTTGPGTQRAR
jgi:hypothetical protein